MSSIKTTYDDPALGGKAIARDQGRELLGQVMGYVAVTVGFAALGAYLGRNLSGGTGLVLFIGAFGCISGLNIAAAKGREQVATGLLFGLGLPSHADAAGEPVAQREQLALAQAGHPRRQVPACSIGPRSCSISTARSSASTPSGARKRMSGVGLLDAGELDLAARLDGIQSRFSA